MDHFKTHKYHQMKLQPIPSIISIYEYNVTYRHIIITDTIKFQEKLKQ